MKLQLIIEKNAEGNLSGRVEGKGNFLPATIASTPKEIIINIKDLITDYLEHEGKDDKFWKKVKVNDLEFELTYDGES